MADHPKKRKRRMKTFKMNEISGVDRPMQEGASVVLFKGDNEMLTKRMRMTMSVDGHSHLIDDDNQEGGHTSFSLSADAEFSHSHPWIKRDDGTIMVGDAEGHSHNLMQKSYQEVDTIKYTIEQRELMAKAGVALPDGSFPIFNEASLKKALSALDRAEDEEAAVHHVVKRAKELDLVKHLPTVDKFTKLVKVAASGGKGSEGGSSMTDVTKAEQAAIDRAETAEAATKRVQSIVDLPVAQLGFFKGIEDTEAQDVFLAKSADARKSEVDAAELAKKDSDPIAYTATSGEEFRKSDGEKVISLAKRADASEKHAAEETALRKRQDLEKRADDELSHLPGDKTAKAALLSAIDGMSEDVRKSALELLAAGDSAMAKGFNTIGDVGGGNELGSAEAELDKLAKALSEKTEGLSFEKAYIKVLETEEGGRLLTASRTEG